MSTHSLHKTSLPLLAVAAFLLAIGTLVGALGPLGVLAPLALAYLCFCLVRPGAGLAWSFAALPLALPELQVAGIHIQPFELLVWPASLIALGSALEKRQSFLASDLRTLAPLLTVGGYLLIASLLLWGAEAPLEARRWASALFFGVACYAKVPDEDFQLNLPRAFVFSAVSLCVLGLSQHYLGVPLFRGFEEPRDLLRLFLFGDQTPVRLANLTFEHFNSAGAYLTLVVGVLFGLSLSNRPSRAIRAALLFAILALYLTYSRGAAIATLAGMAAAAYLVARVPLRIALTSGAAAAAIGGLIVGRFMLLSDYATTVSLGARALIWRAYEQAWLTSPLFGLGPGNGFVAASFLSPFGDRYAAHNNFLYLAADFGIAGVLVALYGFGAVAFRAFGIDRDTRRTQPYLIGGVAIVTALAVHSLVDHTLILFSYRVALFGMLALSLRPQAGAQADVRLERLHAPI